MLCVSIGQETCMWALELFRDKVWLHFCFSISRSDERKEKTPGFTNLGWISLWIKEVRQIVFRQSPSTVSEGPSGMAVAWSFLARIFGECSTILSPPALFMPGSVHSGSASWDDCGRVFPYKLRVSSFPDRFQHYDGSLRLGIASLVSLVAFSSLAKIIGRSSTIHSQFALKKKRKKKISSRTLIPLFRPGSVHSGSASRDDRDRVFPDDLRVSSFPDKFPHYACTAA